MAIVSQNTFEDAAPEAQQLWDDQVQAHGQMTNMKRTLAHSPLALRVYMEWYPLKDRVPSVLGERSTIIFHVEDYGQSAAGDSQGSTGPGRTASSTQSARSKFGFSPALPGPAWGLQR